MQPIATVRIPRKRNVPPHSRIPDFIFETLDFAFRSVACADGSP